MRSQKSVPAFFFNSNHKQQQRTGSIYRRPTRKQRHLIAGNRANVITCIASEYGAVQMYGSVHCEYCDASALIQHYEK